MENFHISLFLQIFFLMTSRLKWIKFKYLKHDVSICSDSINQMSDPIFDLSRITIECVGLWLWAVCAIRHGLSWPSVTRAQRPWWRDLHFDFRHWFIQLLYFCKFKWNYQKEYIPSLILVTRRNYPPYPLPLTKK